MKFNDIRNDVVYRMILYNFNVVWLELIFLNDGY